MINIAKKKISSVGCLTQADAVNLTLQNAENSFVLVQILLSKNSYIVYIRLNALCCIRLYYTWLKFWTYFILYDLWKKQSFVTLEENA